MADGMADPNSSSAMMAQLLGNPSIMAQAQTAQQPMNFATQPTPGMLGGGQQAPNPQ